MAMDASDKRRLQQLSNTANETCQTFVLLEEEHTLGNAVRYMLSKNPDVTFCGYSVPHPSDNKINLRIQTKGAPAVDVLRKGLSDLHAACEHILETFEKAVSMYEEQQQQVDMER